MISAARDHFNDVAGPFHHHVVLPSRASLEKRRREGEALGSVQCLRARSIVREFRLRASGADSRVRLSFRLQERHSRASKPRP